ncbi:arrestin domain-containing protein 17-like isoform X2 [Eurosta solidaginis]|uniref:arrestin domain-containing protein 17-like isoform X2 n=1 Tax=Eurosta solidaginis TaxID=178769 RepID=UPI0035309F71
MVVACLIEFDNNPLCTYFAGQIVTGKITLQADKPKQVKGIRLEIGGFAHTHWSESRGIGNKRRKRHYGGHEDYIKSETDLLGCEEDQTTQIMPGIHTFTFACNLPHNCPTSFEGYYGHIRYMVKVVLIRPWKWNQSYTKGFTVLKVLDLNYESPVLRFPCQAEAEKTFCCGPCKSQPLHMQVSLPQAGYVPGQTIAVSVLISNETNKKITEILVELVMRITNFSPPSSIHKKEERIVVTKTQGDGIPTYCKKLLNYPLIVPATPPTCLNLCKIIHIAYFVEVTIKVKGLHLGHIVSAPVTVGNVPLMRVIQEQPTAKHSFNLAPPPFDKGGKESEFSKDGTGTRTNSESAEVFKVDGIQSRNIGGKILETKTLKNTLESSNNMMESAAPPSPWAKYTYIPLPNYEAAMHMKPGKINANEQHDYGENDFAPRYPVFNIPSPSINDVDSVDGSRFNGDNPVAGVTAKSSTWL